MLKTTPNIIESFSGNEGAWQLPENKLQVILEGVTKMTISSQLKVYLALFCLSLFLPLRLAAAVDENGYFTYEMPIEVPRGTNGMQPDLALSYSSGVKFSPVCQGWMVNGASYITRNSAYEINFDGNDHYLLEGNELIFQADEGLYHAKRETYQRIEAFHLNTLNSYWVVTEKNGTKKYYGATAGSRFEGKGKNGKALMWGLCKVEDINGNYYQVEYVKDATEGDFYPAKVIYTLNDSQPLTKYRAVLISYESRQDIIEMHIPTLVKVDKRAKWITVMLGTDMQGQGGQLVRKYRLDYDYSEVHGNSRLIAVQEYGSDGNIPPAPWIDSSYTATGSTLPATTFEYYQPQEKGWVLDESKPIPFNIYDEKNGHIQGQFADVNGDGRPDWVMAYDSGASDCATWLNTENGWVESPQFRLPTLIYKYDVKTLKTFGQFVDVNCDGRADWVMSYRTNDNYIKTWLSTETGWVESPQFKLPDLIYYYDGKYLELGQFADVNGDGRPDWIMAYEEKTSYTKTWLNTENGWVESPQFRLPTVIYDFSNYFKKRTYGQFVDVNGDGRADWVMAYHTNDTYRTTWLSTENGWEVSPQFRLPTVIYEYESAGDRFNGQFADVNGDGRPDWIQSVRNCNEVDYRTTWLSTETGWQESSQFRLPGFLYHETKTSHEPELIFSFQIGFLLDLNGDGKADYMSAYKDKNDDSIRKTFFATERGWQESIDHRLPYDLMNYVKDNKIYYMNDLQRGRFLDLNGDGQTDNMIAYINSDSDAIRKCYITSTEKNLLVKINHVRGGQTNITYLPATSIEGAVLPDKNAYPAIANRSPRHLVTNVLVKDGLGGQVSTSYEYYNGQIRTGSKQEMENLFFEWIKKTDDNSGNYVKTYYRQDVPYNGFIDKTETYDLNDQLYLVEENKYAFRSNHPAYEEIKFIYQTEKITSNYNGTAAPITYKTEFKSYDAYGNCLETYQHGDLSTTTDDNRTLTSYVYHTAHHLSLPYRIRAESYNLAGTWGQASEKRIYYDDLPLGQVAKGLPTRTEEENGSQDQVTAYGYDAYGNQVREKDGRANNGEYSGYTREMIYENDYQSYLSSEKNALGQTTRIFYNALMQAVENRDINGSSIFTAYDAFGKKVKVIKPGDSSQSPTQELVYDYSDSTAPFCILTQKRETANGTSLDTYTYYDGMGREIQTRTETGTAGVWLSVDKYYDSSGRNSKNSIPYFWSGTPLLTDTTRDPAQQCTITEYDAAGRENKKIKPDGTFTRKIYYQKSTIHIDELQHVTESEVNGNETIKKIYTGVYPDHVLYSTTVIRKAWDGVEMTDAKGNITRTYLDHLGRKTRVDDPNRGTYTYTYDANNNAVSYTDAKNQTIQYEYDFLNRKIQINYPVSADVTLVYDEPGYGHSLGRLTTEQYPGGQKHFTYDERGRITQQSHTIDGITRTVSFSYDSLDRKTSLTLPDGETVHYTYNQGGQLQTIQGTHSYITDVDYNILGLPQQIAYGNGIRVTYDYYDSNSETDPVSNTIQSHRLKTISADQNVYHIEYQYDRAGNVIKKIDHINPAYSESYSYDDLNRLLTAQATAYGTKEFAYDEINNILSMNGRSFTYQGQGFKLLNDGIHSYTYDANGNMIGKKGGSIDLTCTYNEANMLTSAGSAVYTYGNGFGRTKKVEDNITTRYFFKFYQEEANGSSTKTIKYYSSYAKQDSEYGLVFFHKDHLNSSTRITDQNGSLVRSLGYTPYGTNFYSTGDAPVKKKFTGKEQDKNGLYYYGARYYDPDIGRFISPDPAGDGINHYAFCRNNPLKYVDPTGMWSMTSMFHPRAMMEEATNFLVQAVMRFIESVEDLIIQENQAKNTNDPVSPAPARPATSSNKSSSTSGASAQGAGSAFESSKSEGSESKNKVGESRDSRQNEESQTKDDGFLSQTSGKDVLYPKDCMYQATVNSFIEAGYEPTVKTDDLSQYVHDKLVASNYSLGYTKLLEDVFGISNVEHHVIPTGLTGEQFGNTVGSNPAMAWYDQNEFWGKDNLKGNHGVSYYSGTWRDPYRNAYGSFGDIIGVRSKSKLTEYIGGFYFTWDVE